MPRRGRTSTADFRLYDEFRKLPRSEQKTVLRFLTYLAQEEPPDDLPESAPETATARLLRATESSEERSLRQREREREREQEREPEG